MTDPRDPSFGVLPGARSAYPDAVLLDVFRQTAYNRAFEFEVARAFDAKLMKAPIYLSAGQEHIPAVIASVSRDWQIFAQHRAHSYYLSFGGRPAALVDELLHREAGCARGMGGSASIHDPSIPMFGHSGLMGDQVPISVGAALVSKKPTLCIAGDASIEEDYAFGAMAFAITKRAPVLFVCEDNDLSILTRTCTRRSWHMVDVARALHMPAADISDDPWTIAHYVAEFRSQLPAFLNVRTCRHLWHAGTGNDGAPEWNRYELFKEALAETVGRERVPRIEQDAQHEARSVWEERLPKPSAPSLATT